MSWENIKLKNCSLKFIDGDRSSKYPKKSEFRNDAVIFLNANSISKGRFDIACVNYIDQEKFDSISKGRIEANDIIITTRGNGVGQCFFYNGEYGNGLINAQMLIVRTDNAIINPKYLYYFFISDACQRNFINYSSGSAQPQLPITALKEIQVTLPPIKVQNSISLILSNYDNSIENNLKRIKLLEETAQNIYKEWFVNFRFPNYEHTPFDEVSGLPVEWRKGKVSDLCDVRSGYAFKSKDWKSQGNPVMKIKNITNNTVNINDCDYVDDEVAKNAEKFELFEGDVLIAMTGATVGKVGLIPKIDKRIYINQLVGLFRPNSENINNVGLVFTFFMTDEGLKQILNFAGGAAQPNISSNQISNVELNIATVDVLTKFNDVIQSLLIQIQTLYSQNQKLKEARDILLPRLMNTTIEV